MLDEPTMARARAAVGALADRLGLEDRIAPYAPFLWPVRVSRLSTLHLEDVSGIPFVSIVPGVEEYQHRARVRAGDGDMFAAVTAPTGGYEDYCRKVLGLGSPKFVGAEPTDDPCAVATSCTYGTAFDTIVRTAEESGGLAIHPYMAIEPVWTLATRVAESAGVPVHVLGPPPPVLWIANDKALFSEVVASVLSPEFIVETHAAWEPVEMAEHLVRLAERHRRVGLKRTRCASATGNVVFDPDTLRSLPPENVLAEVRSFLERTEWGCDEEVLIVAWEETDDSPSTQLWIPPSGEGAPVVEGVYEQLLEGEERVFLGSRPSTLPPPVNAKLIDLSLRVGTALQALGYVGRCSFDFILVGDPNAEYQVKFTECNGRWGGTSTPMRLVDRLVPGPRPSYRAQDYMHHDLIGVEFAEVVRRVGDGLYDPATGRGRFIFYNVGPLILNGKLDVIALGSTPVGAEDAIRNDLPARLGLAE